MSAIDDVRENGAYIRSFKSLDLFKSLE